MEREKIMLLLPLVAGYLLDLVLGDPLWLPHPVRLFGFLIARGEALLNKPPARKPGIEQTLATGPSPVTGLIPVTELSPATGLTPVTGLSPATGLTPMTGSTPATGLTPMTGSTPATGLTPMTGVPSPPTVRLPAHGAAVFCKGMILTIFLCGTVFLFFQGLLNALATYRLPLYLIVSSIFVFYGLANRQLVLEGKRVFETLQVRGIEAGRLQLSRIVGRDTSRLTAQQIRVAVLETLSENLGDGVIAPLFYYMLAGVPGMMTYKMINTLDSMIGYRDERYEQFGKFAARLDDAANFIPARLTALLMVLVTSSRRGIHFIFRYGHQHKSPNAGYPEAALAGILDARFGGPNLYHGILVKKPFIGINDRLIQPEEITRVSGINHRSCLLMITLLIIVLLF